MADLKPPLEDLREQIRRNLSVTAYARHQGAKLRRVGNQARGSCPLCGGSENATKFSVSPNGQVWKCHACDRGGDIFTLAQELNPTRRFQDLVRDLAEFAGLAANGATRAEPATRKQRSQVYPRQSEHPNQAEKLAPARWESLATDSEQGRCYLESRGIELSGDVRFDDHAQRICVALRQLDGRITNVVSRFYGREKKVRGLRSCRTAGMFGDFRKLDDTTGPVMLVEGVTDWLTARQLWPERLVLGAHGAGRMAWIADAIAAVLATKGRPLCIVPDRDSAGEKAAHKATKAAVKAGLSSSAITWAVLPAEGDDLNDLLTKYNGQLDKLTIEPVPQPKNRPPHTEKADKAGNCRIPVTMVAPSIEPHPLAEHFLEHRATDPEGLLTLRYWQGQFWQYGQGRYHSLSTIELDVSIRKHLDRTCVAELDENGELQLEPVRANKRLVSEVIAALPSRGLMLLGNAPQWLIDESIPHVDLVPCANGILHLPSGELWPHTPNYFTTMGLPVPYEADAPEPTHWLNFLNSLWQDDHECIETLQEYMGYLLTTDTSQHKALFLHGPKRAGKGTIAKVLYGLFGPQNIRSPTLTHLTKDFGLQPLLGIPIAIIPDARIGRSGDRWRAAEVILSITGEDEQLVDRKYMGCYYGRVPTRFVLMSNELPALRDNAAALASRFIMLGLVRSFYGQEDLGLQHRLLSELPGILNFAIAGWRRLRERGHFVQPSSGRELLQQFEDLNSPVQAFVRERCVVDPDMTVGKRALFDAWKEWAETHGHAPGNDASFGRNIRAVLPEVTTARKAGARRERCYVGLGLTA